ncbi:MAG: type II toxin-antitoxin system VapC family toxin [Betaproteobacteria bacterium]|nr:type II toxin-antitoxin system VapC family toxin [Betaproteobacteria bacterium]
MTGVVLDSSAVLAIINAEPGAERVIELLDGALLSAVNHAEVMTKLIERGIGRDLARSTVLNIGVQVIEFGIDLADRTGELRRQTRHLGLSLADRACLALAERARVPAVTADRKWAAADLGIDILLIR